jgi:hypothetical protein
MAVGNWHEPLIWINKCLPTGTHLEIESASQLPHVRRQ